MAMQPTIPEPAKHDCKLLGLVWVKCTQPLLSLGLEKALEAKAHVHRGRKAPERCPSLVVLCTNGEDIASEVGRLKTTTPDAPVLVLGSRAELPLARAGLEAGASGFLHAQMPPEHIARALSVAAKGEVVLPRELLRAMVEEERSSAGNLAKLTPQKREILGLVTEGLSNAQIARRFFLSESTIKQHLRAAYKILGVRNRTQAAKLFRRGKPVGSASHHPSDVPPAQVAEVSPRRRPRVDFEEAT